MINIMALNPCQNKEIRAECDYGELEAIQETDSESEMINKFCIYTMEKPLICHELSVE